MLELRILTGLHRGAAVPLEGETIRIGSAAQNDIVLLDPGMPASACAIYRAPTSEWLCRVFDSESQSTALGGQNIAGGTALVAGARWFAGPVLIGCEDEAAPWGAEPTRSGAQSRKRPVRLGTKLTAAAGIVLLSTATAALLRWPSEPTGATAASAASLPDAASGPVRIVSGTLYPSEAVRKPPFAIRSASTGPYGFLVTEDEHVLIVGSRWRGFTLVKIDAERALFTGPYRAELKW
jgi:type III secretion protein D|nr:FHA domain-containing protein [Trinickia diaoshuihuensis]